MRPCVSRCAALAALFAFSWAQEAIAQDWLRQAIPIDNRSHDFGNVARAANTEHQFRIKNTQQTDLHIRSVRASCGCTTPTIETKIVKPGETGIVSARFNTDRFTGQKAATLTVSISYGQPQRYTELQLNVRGYIRSDVVFHPGQANFGDVPIGEARTMKLSLDYAGRSDWKIEEITSPYRFLTVDFEEQSREGNRIKYELTFELDESAPLGDLSNQVVLHTNDRRLKTVPLQLNAKVTPPVSTSPQLIQLGDVEFGSPISKRLVIKGRKPFKILDIQSKVAEIVFEASDSAKQAHLLNITLSPSIRSAGKVSGEIVLQTDLMPEPTKIKIDYNILNDAKKTVPVSTDASD